RFVDLHLGVGRGVHVAVLLPIEGIRLVKGNFVAVAGKLAQHAAVISGGTVPVRAEQGRTVECELHAATFSGASNATMPSNCSARWAQLWRARMVARPCAARCARRAGSAANARRCAVISSPVAATR